MKIIRGKTFPAEYQTWEPMSVELRSAWCHAMLTYYPILLNPAMMVAIQSATEGRGWHESGDWIQLAKEFDVAGFTPQEFVLLNDVIGLDPRSRPAFGYTPNPEYVPNSLVTLSGLGDHRRNVRLRPTDWTAWLQRVRAGEDPGAVGTEILAPHWGEPAEVIHT